MLDIRNVDCMELMAQFEDKHFDLAICDPPYGIGMDGGNVGYKGFNNFEKKNWDKAIPTPEYFTELKRVSKNQIIWGGNYFGLPAARCFVIWDKGEGFKNRTYAECEMAWTSFDRNAKIYKRDPLAKGDYKGKVHPCQKPIRLYEFLLKEFATEGMKILDTHLGSGNIAVACHYKKFDLTACEIDKGYFEDAMQNIKDKTCQIEISFNH